MDYLNEITQMIGYPLYRGNRPDFDSSNLEIYEFDGPNMRRQNSEIPPDL